MTALRVSAIAAFAFAAAATTAPAAITSTYSATPPKTLTVTSDEAGDTIVFTCSSGIKINGAPPPSGAVACTEVTRLEVNGNDGADTVDVTALDPDDDSISTLTLTGGEGDDDLRGRFDGGTMALLGEGGNDTLTTPANTTQGGPGDDRLVGFPDIGSSLEGDAGDDAFVLTSLPSGLNLTVTVRDSDFALSAPEVAGVQTFPWTSIEAVDLTLSDAAQTVDAAGFSGSARVLGKGGSDTLLGTANADQLDGGLGNDFLDGGSGPDVYQGGPGFDQVRARDGFADSGDCGSDDDTLFVDVRDSLVGCELIDAPPGPPAAPTPAPSPAPAPDTTAPVLTLGSALVNGRALRLPVTCAAGEVRCAGVLTLTATGRRGKQRRTVQLGPATLSLAGAATANVTRRMSRRQRRTLRRLKRRRLRVGVDVVDAAGNRTRVTQTTALSLS